MSAPRSIRTVVVDDEPLARERLRTLIARDGRLAVVAECGDGASAIEAIERLRPDLLFLDVQMPGVDGFDVIAGVRPSRLPRVIFVTAYDTHAIRAFEVGAVDYLLKPFDRERFARAVERAVGEVDRATRPDMSDVLVVKSAGRVLFLPIDSIQHVRAAGNYAEIHSDDGVHLLRQTMDALLRRLDPDRFMRVSRSAIVAVARVRELRPAANGAAAIVLDSTASVPLSRRYRDAVAERLGL